MAANTSPIYCKAGDPQWTVLSAVNAAMDGTGTIGTNIFTVYTAPGDGGRVELLRARALGSNVASVLRVFLNNGNSNATPANNTLWGELTLPLTTASAVAALQDQFLSAPYFPLVLQSGFRILVTLGTAVAAGYAVTVAAGKY